MSPYPHTPLPFYDASRPCVIHSSVKRKKRQLNYEYGKELIVDGFAGGGGASTGIEMALGVSPDIAINHDPEAIALHMANHPYTRHYISDIFEVNPLIATMGRPVGLFWLSPDCKHHSKAKGGKPRDNNIRSLAWVAVKWAKAVKPRVIMLENVEEFQHWCPLDGKCQPDMQKKGETFREFIGALEALGYEVQWRELKASDFGAPTIRKRLFMVARCDGRPIVFPEPTHGDPQSKDFDGKKLKPYRTAAEIIDWSIPTYSIFLNKEQGKKYGVRRPLSPNTMDRIAKGFEKFVMKNEEPYVLDESIAPYISTYYGKSGNADNARGQKVDAPLATITAGGQRHGLVTPFIVKNMNKNVPRLIDEPVSTILTGNHHFLTVPFVSQLNKNSIGSGLSQPTTAITGVNKHSLVTPYMMAIDHTSSKNSTWSIKKPLSTITSKNRHAVVGAFLHKYYGVEERQGIDTPLHTITTRDRFGLVEIKGIKYQVMDIGFRMLTPRELYLAQGFPEDYKINIVMPTGKVLSKAAQVRMCGNSVVPILAKALVEANYDIENVEEKAAS